jgi:phosphatidylglycerophosphate synthase
MHVHLKKQHIPWAMTGTRAALGPILLAGASCGWNGLALAAMVVAALVSDIYDGVLARRWHCDTSAVRLFDSMADTFFYLCTAGALWIVQPTLWHRYAAPLAVLLTLEAVRFAFDFRKFGKPTSYHSWLAKTWGLTLAIAVIAAFAKGWSHPLVPIALWTGIVCNLQGLAMSVALPAWRKDVKSFRAAWLLRNELLRHSQQDTSRPGASQQDANRDRKQRMLRKILVAGALCTLTLPLFAVEAGQVVYVSGTSPTIANNTLGSLNTALPTALIFRGMGNTSGAELDIPYKNIRSFQYSSEVARHLGVLPAVTVGLVRRRERQHFFSISYIDESNTPQAVVFEVPKHDPRGLLTILRARAPQACGKVTNGCGGFVP